MKKYKKLILAGTITVALLGGTGVAMAAVSGAEKGHSSVKHDDGKPSLHKDGTAPSNGGKPETHTYKPGKDTESYRTPNKG